MLSLEQANMLFAKEAVVLGGDDRVPLYRVKELFGEKAARFADSTKPVRNGSVEIVYSNWFGVGEYGVEYLTYHGFLLAATYANVLEVKKKEQEKERTSDGKAD